MAWEKKQAAGAGMIKYAAWHQEKPKESHYFGVTCADMAQFLAEKTLWNWVATVTTVWPHCACLRMRSRDKEPTQLTAMNVIPLSYRSARVEYLNVMSLNGQSHWFPLPCTPFRTHPSFHLISLTRTIMRQCREFHYETETTRCMRCFGADLLEPV